MILRIGINFLSDSMTSLIYSRLSVSIAGSIPHTGQVTHHPLRSILIFRNHQLSSGDSIMNCSSSTTPFRACPPHGGGCCGRTREVPVLRLSARVPETLPPEVLAKVGAVESRGNSLISALHVQELAEADAVIFGTDSDMEYVRADAPVL